jgi:hypothetical protein
VQQESMWVCTSLNETNYKDTAAQVVHSRRGRIYVATNEHAEGQKDQSREGLDWPKGLEVEAIVVMVIPPTVRAPALAGIAGGFLRLGGAGGAERRPEDRIGYAVGGEAVWVGVGGTLEN